MNLTLTKVVLWLATLETNSPRIRFLPNWVNPIGWFYHLIVGFIVRLISPHYAFSFCLGIGVGHEWADGDFKNAYGLDGILDVVFFCIPTLL